MACLYRIDFPSGKAYIGVTSGTAQDRFAEHVYNAKRGLGRGINRALRKYGVAQAKVTTLVIGAWDYILDLERKAIAAFNTKGPHGYNMTDGGEGALGYRHTPESLKRMGDVHRGKAHHNMPHTDEAKAKMSAMRLGVKKSPEARAAISAGLIGNKYSLGRKLTDEHRAAISAKNSGRKWSEEAKARMSEVARKREADKQSKRPLV